MILEKSPPDATFSSKIINKNRFFHYWSPRVQQPRTKQKSKWAFFANFPAWKECDSGRENGVREEDFVHFKDPKKKQGLDTQSCNLRHIFYSEALVLDVGENPFYALIKVLLTWLKDCCQMQQGCLGQKIRADLNFAPEYGQKI